MKRLVRVALAAAATVGAHDGYAQTYPTKPVRMVVARSTQASLTFNLPTPAGWQPS